MPQSIESAQIKTLLQKREFGLQRKSHPTKSSREQSPNKSGQVLIYNTAAPGELPNYVSSLELNPDSKDSSPRKQPVLATTALGMPFLRRTKPQPYAMSRMIGVKSKRFENKVQSIVAVDEWMAADAALEDAWDALVEQQQRDEARQPKTPVADPRPEETYTWSVQLSRVWWEWQAEKTWQDWLARGKALQGIVDAGKPLKQRQAKVAERPASSLEEKLRSGRRSDNRQTRAPSASLSHPKGQVLEADVAFKPATTLPLALLVQQPKRDDPFCTKAWADVIDYHRSRLFKYTFATLGRADARPGQSARRER